MDIKQMDIVLCEFYFSDLNKTKKRPVLVFKDNLPYDDFVQDGSIKKISKLITRKTFVVSKKVVIKKYGTLKNSSFVKYHNSFCKYFGCNDE